MINSLFLYQNFVKTITGIREYMRANNLILTVILFAFSLSGLAQSGALDIVKSRYPLIYTYIMDEAEKQWGYNKNTGQREAEDQAKAFLSIAEAKRPLDSRLLSEALINNSLQGAKDYNIKIINDRTIDNPYAFLYCDWLKVKEYYNNEVLSPGSMSRQVQEPRQNYATAPERTPVPQTAQNNVNRPAATDSRNYVSEVQTYDNTRSNQVREQKTPSSQGAISSVYQTPAESVPANENNYASRTESPANNVNRNQYPTQREERTVTKETAPTSNTGQVQSYDRVSEVREFPGTEGRTSTYQRNTGTSSTPNRTATGSRRYYRDIDETESKTKSDEKPFNIGVKVEGGMNTLLGFNGWDQESDEVRKVNPALVFGGGIAAIYRHNGFFVQNETGIQYGDLDFKHNGWYSEGVPAEYTYKINSLNLRTAIHIGAYTRVSDNVQFVAGVGPYLDFNLSSKIKNIKLTVAGENFSESDNIDLDLKKTNFGIAGLFGFEFNKRVRVALYPGYGFGKLHPDYDGNLLNILLGVTVWAF